MGLQFAARRWKALYLRAMSILKPKQPRPTSPLPQLRSKQGFSLPTWAIIFIALIVSLGLITVIGQTLSQASREASVPLGPTLPAFHGTPLVGGNAAPLLMGGTLAAPGALPLGTPPPPPPGTPRCGGPDQLFLLLAGLDNEANYDNALADSIRVARFDFIEPSISILTIQRDSWVVIPDLPSNASKNLSGFLGQMVNADGSPTFPPADYGKINIAYFYGNLYELPGGGPALLAKTIYLNFGVPSDNYLVMNMAAFRDVVDAMGGLDIDVPRDLNDPEKDWYFKRGIEHMDGERALEYARIRHPDSDWDRTARQTQIMMAVRDKMLQPDHWKNVPAIINQFIDNVRTDLSRDQITQLLCLASQTPQEGIRTYDFSEKMSVVARTDHGASVVLINPVAAGNQVYEFLYGPPR